MRQALPFAHGSSVAGLAQTLHGGALADTPDGKTGTRDRQRGNVTSPAPRNSTWEQAVPPRTAAQSS